MDVSVVVEEVAQVKKISGKVEQYFVAAAEVSAGGMKLRGSGAHVDQDAAEALAVADLKFEYRRAFPPKKIVITKTVSVNFDA